MESGWGRYKSGWGWYKRLKASGILTSPDWIMLCHTAFSSSHHFVSKYGKDSFSGFWSECQGQECMNRTMKCHKIKYDKHDKHDSDPIQGWVTLWSKLVLHRSCYRYSGVRCVWILAGCRTILTILLVRLSQLSDYRIELSVRPRPIWSWPFQSSADINAWTMRPVGVVGEPSAKFWLI